MKRGILAVGTIPAAAVPVMTGCGAGSGNGGCSIRVDDVHESTGAPGQMGAKAIIECDVAVTEARLEVRLEQEQGGAWTLNADNLNSTGKENPYIGSMKPKQRRTRQVFVTCAPGTYRVAARGSAVLDGVPSGSAAWEYSTARTDPCAKAG